ncbi:MAG: antibiotic biosynthesis monooxygenase [Dehalococcoidia bacterium]|jgi:heme oxygenase (staphylobilin-producing)|nr:antibiotic biosynthesis monooxygenase [Dehalococcoidia bacterium]|tara:strand:+ start:842 stop:1147 length:306 start_codon:yes stop_codon:yes gene_type:complete
MYSVTNRIMIKSGNGDDMEAVFAKRGNVQNEPGFKSFELWKLQKEGDHEVYLVVTRWESEDDFKAWTQSASFKESHAGPHPDYILGGELSNYDIKLSIIKS